MNSKSNVISIYKKRAKRYDQSTSIFYNLLGLRVKKQRKLSIQSLNLNKGDTVVEIGCGTGENFPFIQNSIGSEGKIIGVELTTEMIEQAQKKVKQNGWDNVKLVNKDAGEYNIPDNLDGILSTFALTMIPEYEEIIINGKRALKPEGKLVVMDFKMPSNILSKFSRIIILLVRPYGGTLDMADRHPWEVIKKHFNKFRMKSFWFDMAYIAEGEKISERIF